MATGVPDPPRFAIVECNCVTASPRPYARKDDGKIILRLTQAHRCRHLKENNACGIYAFRPDACAVFPVASECCLSTRASVGLTDGVPE